MRDLTSSGKAGGTLGIKGEILLPMARNAIVALTLAYASDTGRTWRGTIPKAEAWSPWLDPPHLPNGPEHLKATVTNPGMRQTPEALIKPGERL